MILLSDYLEEAPSVLLQRMYRRFQSSPGLVSNAQVRQDVYAWANNLDRLQQVLAELRPDELLWLKRLYLDPHSHWNLEKMTRLVPAADRFRVMPWLDRLSWDFFVARLRQGELRWAPFRELMPLVLSYGESPIALAADRFQSFGEYFSLHSLRLMAWAKLTKLKVNQSGELNQKSSKSLLDTFWTKAEWSAGFAEFEVQFILKLMDFGGYLSMTQGLLYPKSNFEKDLEGSSLWLGNLVHLWLQYRGISKLWLKEVLQWLETPISASVLCDYFGAKILPTSAVHVESLPEILREMLCLGLLSVDKSQARIEFIRSSAQAITLLDHLQNRQAVGVFSTPNFELHLPCMNIQWGHYLLECLSQLDKENVMLKYTLRKENFFAGMSQEFSQDQVKQWSQGLALSPSVQVALDQWLGQTTGIGCEDALWLSIPDRELREKILQFTQLRDLCLGVDPDAGLVVSPLRFKELQVLLETFGMQIRQNKIEATDLVDRKIHGYSNSSQPLEYDFQHHEPKDAVELQLSDSFVFGRHTRELDFGQKLRVFEYAILNDQAVELFDSEGVVDQVFLPVRIHRQTNPIRVEGFAGGADQMSMLEVSEIFSLRLI